MHRQNEFEVKTEMVERLNLLLHAEPTLVTTLINTHYSVGINLAKTNFVVTGATPDSPRGLLNLLGIVDGLFGHNYYKIEFNNEGCCFTLTEVEPNTFMEISVNTQSERILTKAEDNDNENQD